LRDGSLVQSYRHRAQQRVQKFYDWERVVDDYEQLFEKLTGITKSTETSVVPVSETANVAVTPK